MTPSNIVKHPISKARVPEQQRVLQNLAIPNNVNLNLGYVLIPPDSKYDKSIPILSDSFLKEWIRNHSDEIYKDENAQYEEKLSNFTTLRKQQKINRSKEKKENKEKKINSSLKLKDNHKKDTDLVIESQKNGQKSWPKRLNSSSSEEDEPLSKSTRIELSSASDSLSPPQPVVKRKTTAKRQLSKSPKQSSPSIDNSEKKKKLKADETEIKDVHNGIEIIHVDDDDDILIDVNELEIQKPLGTLVKTKIQTTLDINEIPINVDHEEIDKPLNDKIQTPVKNAEKHENVNSNQIHKCVDNDEIQIHVEDDEFAKYKDYEDEDFQVSKTLRKIRPDLANINPKKDQPKKDPPKANTWNVNHESHKSTNDQDTSLKSDKPNHNTISNHHENINQNDSINKTNGIANQKQQVVLIQEQVISISDEPKQPPKPNWSDTKRRFENNELHIVYRDLRQFSLLVRTEALVESLPRDLIFKCFQLDQTLFLSDLLDLIFDLEYHKFTDFWSELVLRFKRKLTQFGQTKRYKSNINPDKVYKHYEQAMVKLTDYAKKTNLKFTLPFHDMAFIHDPINFINSKEAGISIKTVISDGVANPIDGNQIPKVNGLNTEQNQESNEIAIVKEISNPQLNNNEMISPNSTNQMPKPMILTNGVGNASKNCVKYTLRNRNLNAIVERKVNCVETDIRGKMNFKISISSRRSK